MFFDSKIVESNHPGFRLLNQYFDRPIQYSTWPTGCLRIDVLEYAYTLLHMADRMSTH